MSKHRTNLRATRGALSVITWGWFWAFLMADEAHTTDGTTKNIAVLLTLMLVVCTGILTVLWDYERRLVRESNPSQAGPTP